MRVGITQPNFLPWLGYFDLLDRVDVWVSLDNVQRGRSRQSFTIRNRVRLRSGKPKWLQVRLQESPPSTTILEQQLASGSWPTALSAAILDNYKEARYFDQYREFISDLLRPRADEESLSRYNERIIGHMSQVFGVSYQFHRSSDLVPTLVGTAQDKIFALLEHFSATDFLNFQRGVEAGLYDEAAFSERNIRLVKHMYRHPTYRQFGEGFEPFMSAIDLLLHEGPSALAIIRSGSNWTVM